MIDMLNFLLENDVILSDFKSKRMMSADDVFELQGEFVVYDGGYNEFYRGTDFEVALSYLTGKGE